MSKSQLALYLIVAWLIVSGWNSVTGDDSETSTSEVQPRRHRVRRSAHRPRFVHTVRSDRRHGGASRRQWSGAARAIGAR